MNPTTDTECPPLLKDNLSESFFKSLYQKALEPIFIYNYIDEKLIDCNEAAIKTFGYSKQEFLSMTRYDLIDIESYSSQNQQFIIDLMAEETAKIIDGLEVKDPGRFKTKEGKSIYCLTLIVPTGRVKGEAFISIKDQTELLKANKALEKSNNEIVELVEKSPLAIIQFDKKGKVLMSTPSAQKTFGYTKQEFAKKDYLDLVDISFKSDFKKLAEQTIASSKNSGKLDIHCVKKDGQSFRGEVYVKKSLDNQGAVKYISFFRDKTIEVQNDNLITEKNLAINALIETQEDQIMIIDLQDKITLVNKFAKHALSEIYGVTPYIGDNYFEKVNPFGGKAFKDLIEKAKTGVVSNYNYTSKYDQFNDQVFSDITISPVRDSNKIIQGVIFIARDVTDIRKREALLNTIIDSAPDSIFAIDRNYQLLAFNKKCKDEFKSIVNIEISDGMDFRKEFPKELFEDWDKRIFQKVFEGQSFKSNVKHKFAGAKMYAQNNYAPLKNDNNEIIGCLEVGSDVTLIKNAELEIEKRKTLLNTIIENSPNSIIATDKNGIVILHNRQASSHYKKFRTKQVKIGESIKNLFPKKLDSFCNENFESITKDGETHQKEIKHTINNQIHTFKVIHGPIIGKDKEIIGLIETIIDITDITKSKTQSNARLSRLKAIMNGTPDAILVLDKELKILDINKKAEKKYKKEFGINVKEGDLIFEIINKKSWPELEECINNSHQGLSTEYIQTVKSNNNKNLYYEINILPAIDAKSRLFGTTIVSRNITDKINQQKAVKNSEKKFKDLFNNSNQGIAIYCLEEGKFKEHNINMLNIFGLKSGTELYSKKLIDFLAPEQFEDQNSEETLSLITSSIRESSKVNLKLKVKQTTGKIVIADFTGLFIKEKNHLIIFMSDITNMYQVQNEIRERKAIYEALVENSFDGVDIIEITNLKEFEYQGKMLLRNSKMQNLLNQSKSLLLNPESILDVSSEITLNGDDTVEKYKELIKKVVEERSATFEWQLNGAKGLVDVNVKNQLLVVEDKTLLIRVCRDITEEKERERIIENQITELDKKARQLEMYIESNLQLENFAYIASHDLKAPLRTISSFAYLLKDNCYQNLDLKGKRFLDILLRSSVHMQLLIEDLLKFSRVNSQKISLENIKLDVLIERILVENEVIIKQSNLTVNISDLPAQITADRIKIFQLFQNLILNAAKFSKVGLKPEVMISCTESTNSWCFSIADNGIGIRKDHFKKIFGIFEKLHSNDKYTGTGLGLTICKKIVDQHDGEIWVESDGQNGSTFLFTIKKTKV